MRMRARLSLQNLNTFATAAQTLSFQKAADRLHVTPSAVSHQIRHLESRLGYALFERYDKRVELTDRGRQLYLDIREPLKQLHQASDRALRSPEDRSLALSVAPVFATRWLLPRLKDFRTQHPDISLSVIATSTMTDFHNDGIDAAVRIGDGHWPELQSTLLFCARTVAVCHPDLIHRQTGPLTPEQIASQPLVHNTLYPDQWRQWLISAGVRPPATLAGIEVQGVAQVLEAVQAGDVIGLADRHFIENDLRSGRLALACNHTQADTSGFYLTYPKAQSERTALQCFEHWLLAQVQGTQ